MVASVQELLAAAQGKYQRPRSKITELNDIITGGFDAYDEQKNRSLDVHRKLAEQQIRKEEEARRLANKPIEDAARAKIKAKMEDDATRQAAGMLNGTNPTTPAEKLYEEMTFNSDGTYSIKSETPKVGDAKKVEAQNYYDENSKTMRIGKRDFQGNIIRSPDDPLLENPNKAAGDSASLAYQKEKDAQAASTKQKQLKVRGFDLSSDIEPGPEEAKKARESAGGYDSFTKGMNKLRKMVEENGAKEFVGAKSGEVASLVAGLQLDYKKIAQLGVLSKSDQVFLDAVVYNPSDLVNVFRQKGSALGQLNESLRRSRENLVTGLGAIGYKPSADFDSVYSVQEHEQLPPGTVQDGYRFKGGNPSDQSSWEKL